MADTRRGAQMAPIETELRRIAAERILVLDGALSVFGAGDENAILKRMREAMTGRTLIATVSDPAAAEGFDTTLSFDGSRLKMDPELAAAVA